MQKDGQFILMTKEDFKNYIDNLKIDKKFTTIQVHHTASPSYSNCTSTNQIKLMKSMKNYHLSRGFQDIAQHCSTFPSGEICLGRPFTLNGGGFLGNQNINSITIENVGNFDKHGDIISKEQKETIIFVYAVLCHKFNISPSTSTILYHTWMPSANKTCPGNNFFGGNTKEDANKYFIPLIKSKITELYNTKPKEITFEEALKVVSDKIDTSYNYWYSKKECNKYFKAFIIKLSMCDFHKLNNIQLSFEQALKIVSDKAKIDYNYWYTNRNTVDKFYQALIVKCAKCLM
jgi:hypothetical protein